MNRRSFLFGAVSLLAAPAIVRVASIMPVSAAAMPPVHVWPATQYGGVIQGVWVQAANGQWELSFEPALIKPMDGLLAPAIPKEDLQRMGRLYVCAEDIIPCAKDEGGPLYPVPSWQDGKTAIA